MTESRDDDDDDDDDDEQGSQNGHNSTFQIRKRQDNEYRRFMFDRRLHEAFVMIRVCETRETHLLQHSMIQAVENSGSPVNLNL